MSNEIGTKSIPHQVVRLDLSVGQDYDCFRRRFEIRGPRMERGSREETGRTKGPEMVADVNAAAPNEFLLYWRLDLTPLMSLAGKQPPRHGISDGQSRDRGDDVPARSSRWALRPLALPSDTLVRRPAILRRP